MVRGISIPATIGRSGYMGVSMMDEHGEGYSFDNR